MNSLLGYTPASEYSVALTIIIKRTIVPLLSRCELCIQTHDWLAAIVPAHFGLETLPVQTRHEPLRTFPASPRDRRARWAANDSLAMKAPQLAHRRFAARKLDRMPTISRQRDSVQR